MTFPILTHADQLRPLATRDRGFSWMTKRYEDVSYEVVDYVFQTGDTFRTDGLLDPMLRECRGLKFHPDGTIAARPLHKFFNLGEAIPAEQHPWEQAYHVEPKHDGSMIHTCVLDGRVFLMTRGGITEHAVRAMEAWTPAHQALLDLLAKATGAPVTLIMEWTAPHNRIVLPYKTSDLRVLAARYIETGLYVDSWDLVEACHAVQVPQPLWPQITPRRGPLPESVTTEEGIEGYVVVFPSQERVKVKTEWYIVRHRAKDGIQHPHHLLMAWLDQALDDVRPLLDADDLARVDRFDREMGVLVAQTAAQVTAVVDPLRSEPRKLAAQTIQATLPQWLWPVAFKTLDGTEPMVQILSQLRKVAQGAANYRAADYLPRFTEEASDAL